MDEPAQHAATSTDEYQLIAHLFRGGPRLEMASRFRLLAAARTLGRLVGGGELSADPARAALLEAAAGHVGVDGYTAREIDQTIADGIAFGRRSPRRIRATWLGKNSEVNPTP